MLTALNTKSIGLAGVLAFILTLAANQNLRDAIVATVQHPNPTSVSAAIGMAASLVLAYFGMPAQLQSSATSTSQNGSK